MNISGPFIRRPIATSLLATAIFLAGIGAYFQLPVSPLPGVDFPTISVDAQLPGASPETMASAVATPLERRFGRIAGISEITSTSTLGQTSLTLQFDLDRDVSRAARDVQAAINAAGAELPPNLPMRPMFRKVNPADAPALIIALSSKIVPIDEVNDVVNNLLVQKMSQVDGVGQVFVGGSLRPAVRVQVDPAALAGTGLGMDDVRTAISQSSADTPKGNLAGPQRGYSIAANDQLFGAEDFRKVIIAYRGGAAVRVGDVARVEDGVENNRGAAWSNGRRSVLMMIRREPGSNIIATIERIKKILPRLTASIPPSIDVEIVVDRSQTIRTSVRDVEVTLLISVVLVILVVFVFLGSLRATAIPAVAIPLSLAATVAGMYLLGYSLDNLSLMALTISTGFVVDDAIVVAENITRFLAAGLPPREAALRGARQIGFTIISITVSLLAVFVPILFMGGIVGRLFREFAVTLSVAVGMSAVISLTLTPMMCARLLRASGDEPQGRVRNWSDRFSQGLADSYGRVLEVVLRHPIIMAVIAGGTAVLTVVLIVTIPKGLFPQQDTGQINGFAEAGQDVSFLSMRGRWKQVNDILLADPDIENVEAFLGGGGGNSVFCFMSLTPRSKRKASADEIVARVRPKLAQVPGLRIVLQASQDMRLGGRMSRTQYQYTLEDADLKELRTWAPRVLDKLRGLRELRDVVSDQQSAGLQLNVAIDRDTALRLGVSAQAIDQALYDSFGQRQVATSFTQLNYYRVVLEMKPELQRGPEALDRIYVRSSSGAQVPLAAFAKVTPATTPLAITHQGQFPSVTISFNLAPGVALGQAVDAISATSRQLVLPAGMRAAFQGNAQAFSDSLGSEPVLVAAALLVVYIVLGMLYESLVHPITILSTLPSAGVGALLALMLFRMEFSVIALIGIVLLIGIVKKNAIMMIDFALEAERDRNMSPRDAIFQACLLRFRPIMMTTLASLLGALPLTLLGGEGSELRRPLGVTIVGGLLVSQALTLFTTPAVYLVMDRLSPNKRRQPAEAHADGAPLLSTR